MRKLALSILALLMMSTVALAQTTYTSVQANVNIGEPERVIFIFGHVPNGQPGTTELVLQCDFQRGWLITNFDVYGMTQSSNDFPIMCTETGPKAFVLNGTPFTENLTMTDGSQLTLKVNSAAWQLVPCRQSRWGCPVGSAQIAY